MKHIGSASGIGAPLSPNRVGGDTFPRYIGDRLILDFHEGAGATVRDLSGNGNDGTFGAGAAAPTWERGRLNFDGGNYMTISNPTFIDDSQGTLESFLEIDSFTSGQQIIAVNVDGATDDEFLPFYFRGDLTDCFVIVLLLNGGGSWRANTPDNIITDSNPHLVVVNSNGLTVKFFTDNVEQTITDDISSNSGQWFQSATDADILSIGALKRATPVDYFNGRFRFIRINAKAFSALEVLQEYLWNKWRN